MFKALIPIGVALVGTLAQRLLFPGRSPNANPQVPNYAQAGVGSLNWGVGTFFCQPHLIARKKVSSNTKGKGGGKKGGSGPTTSGVYAICKGPIKGVTRIIFNGKVVYDKRPGKNRDLLDGLTGGWGVLDGTQTSILPLYSSILGVGNASHLNGWALLWFEDLRVKDSGGDLPQIEVEVIRYPDVYDDNYFQDKKTRRSAYYSDKSKIITIKASQCWDGVERLYKYTTSERVFAAYLEFQSGSIPNLAGSIPIDSEGRIMLVTDVNPGGFPITPFSQFLGVWHDRGNEITPNFWERAVPLEVEPILVFDESLDGPDYDAIPPNLTGNYFPVPSVAHPSISTDLLALHNRPLTVRDVIVQLGVDFPDTVGHWLDQYNYDLGDAVLGGTLPEFYGWSLEGDQEIFENLVKLFAFLGVDLVDNYGELELINPFNRKTLEIPDSWVSRQYDNDSGKEIPYYTLEELPDYDQPDEVRVIFRDAGRDGEESMAYYRSPFYSRTNNVESFNVPVSMAFSTANTLAFELFCKSSERAGKYTLRLNSRAFGSIKVGHEISFRLHSGITPKWSSPNIIELTDSGYTLDRFVTIQIAQIRVDELFNLEVEGYEVLSKRPLSYDSVVIAPEDDGIPDNFYLQAQVLNIPIFNGANGSTLRKYYQGVGANQGDSVIVQGIGGLSVSSGPFTEFANDVKTDRKNRIGSLTNASTVIKGVIDESSTLSLIAFPEDSFATVSDQDFIRGQGTYLWANGEILRARVATLVSSSWVFSYFVRGIAGTPISTSFTNSQVFILSGFSSKADTSSDLNLIRALKVYTGLQDISLSPSVPFTQDGYTAKPYPITQLQSEYQPNGDRVVTWLGHSIGNDIATNGIQPLNIALGESYRFELLDGPNIVYGVNVSDQSVSISNSLIVAKFGASQPKGTISCRVRQRGDFGLFGPWVVGAI